jgi:hypothetical protein
MLAKLENAELGLMPTSSGSETWRTPALAVSDAEENVLSGCKGELNMPTTGGCCGCVVGASECDVDDRDDEGIDNDNEGMDSVEEVLVCDAPARLCVLASEAIGNAVVGCEAGIPTYCCDDAGRAPVGVDCCGCICGCESGRACEE